MDFEDPAPVGIRPVNGKARIDFTDAGPHYYRAMKVSVLIPVFNAEPHLAECLESVLFQDFSDLEIIISNDASADGSARIIESFAQRDSRIRWWTNPQNLGEAGNSNVCLKSARGEYIKFIHADDKLLSASAIRKMVEAIEAHPGASLVCCRQNFTRSQAGFKLEPRILSDKTGCFSGRRIIITCLERDANLIGNPSHVLFRRSNAKRGFDERFKRLVDYEMWFHLLEQGDCVYLAETLATWRLHPKQQSAPVQGIEPQEGLWLVRSYYEKEWLRAAATPKMLFIQSRALKAKYGSSAMDVVKKLRASLGSARFLLLWVDRKRSKINRWAGKVANRW
ncbi:MAG TPA: glycosyltransferase family 2 protein [Verrucomicrobiae bacterium]|nr:glycosyltransferase family 2 protein [Verrucomicrobiae bacterium]